MADNTALFLVVLFCSLAMDSIKNRYNQSIFYRWGFLREARIFGYKEFFRSDKTTQNRRFKNEDPAQGRKKFLGLITMPPFFFDGWHFFKTFLVGAVCILAAENSPTWFITFSAAWLVIWWLAYDVQYGTKTRDQ